ncbi:SLATT domain-containing protein [Paraburkholderia bryophila]|uniref:SMODS and SLOG-associating 2TM effector domain-containing protein n=1 Tax=Paraburkholderia bryophila TaxID=420952 RepID=A0A7Z0B777_9BURK|nr:SLATT domain-containing protein [Paraburkholderia bryophila]NYH24231.1 hypothetical protein [Paraburkholderia bryophila]
MKKNDLLRLLAESGYNIGFGAKLHFSTLDIVEKAPGWINVIAFIIGVYALIFPALAAAGISATLVIASALTLYVTFYNSDKQKYDDAGVSLTRSYNQLRDLYAEVKAQSVDADVTVFAERRMEIVDAAAGASVSKQIFLAHWHAHVKFFWQHQIGWIDDELNFSLFRDKVPFGAWVTLVILLALAAVLYLHPAIISIVFNSQPCKT